MSTGVCTELCYNITLTPCPAGWGGFRYMIPLLAKKTCSADHAGTVIQEAILDRSGSHRLAISQTDVGLAKASPVSSDRQTNSRSLAICEAADVLHFWT